MLPLIWTLAALGAPPDIDKRLVTGSKATGDAAVIIGIEEYYTLPSVPYAAGDAQTMYNTMLYARGVPIENIQMLQQPNREEILNAVETAAEAVQPGGMLWVYYAGHGMAAPSSGERLLLGVDAKADEQVIEARAVSVAELKDLAARSKGDKNLLILDTCYGGIGRAGLELLPGKRFAVPTYSSATQDNKTSVWTAAQESQLAGPMKQAPHGAFTYFVVGALRGWADGELGANDGVVTLEEAQAYVGRALPSVGLRLQRPSQETRRDVLNWPLLSANVLEDGPDLDNLLEVHSVSGDRLGLLSSQSTGLTKATASEAPIELKLREIRGPVSKLGANVFVDKKDKRIHFNDIKEIAAQKVAGQVAVAKLKRTNLLSIISGVAGGALVIPTTACFMGNAKNETTGGKTCATISVLGAAYGIAGAGYLQASAGRRKTQVLTEANGVLAEFQQQMPTAP
jgi:hypothetical protein